MSDESDKAELKYVEFSDLDNMIRAMVSSRAPLLLHVAFGSRHIYFQTQPGFKETIFYYVELPDAIKEKYVVYDLMKGHIIFSDQLLIDPNRRSIPIVEISRQNIFPKEVLK
ncbi:MAG: hypothetical protein ACFFCD_00145 [Promethearchaeota archaeon]